MLPGDSKKVFIHMRTTVREKHLKQSVTGLFELGDQELKEATDYIGVLRHHAVGRRRAPKNSEYELTIPRFLGSRRRDEGNIGQR